MVLQAQCQIRDALTPLLVRFGLTIPSDYKGPNGTVTLLVCEFLGSLATVGVALLIMS